MKNINMFFAALVTLFLSGTICALTADANNELSAYAEADALALQVNSQEKARASASEKDLFSLEKQNIHAETHLNISIEKRNDTDKNEKKNTTMQIHFSNGRNTEIKIMPITASATALAQIGIHVCSEENNCTIVLKEVGEQKEVKAVYEVKAQKRVRLFGIFNTSLNVSAEVDAETGVVTKSHWPWWAFLTTNAETSASS